MSGAVDDRLVLLLGPEAESQRAALVRALEERTAHLRSLSTLDLLAHEALSWGPAHPNHARAAAVTSTLLERPAADFGAIVWSPEDLPFPVVPASHLRWLVHAELLRERQRLHPPPHFCATERWVGASEMLAALEGVYMAAFRELLAEDPPT